MMTRTRLTTLSVGIALWAMAMTLTPGVSSAQLTRQLAQLPKRLASPVVVESNGAHGGPEAIVFDGTNLWVVLQFSNRVVKAELQRTTSTLHSVTLAKSVPVGNRPVAAAFD